MSRNKFKQEGYKKRFGRPNNPLIRIANRIINNLDGATNIERLGMFELIVKNDQYWQKYPNPMGKDIALIIRQKLQ